MSTALLGLTDARTGGPILIHPDYIISVSPQREYDSMAFPELSSPAGTLVRLREGGGFLVKEAVSEISPHFEVIHV